MTISRTRAAALLISFLAACEPGTEPATPDIASVEIVPSPAQVSVGETLQLQALVRDNLENDIAGVRGLFWSSEEPSIASVSETGVVTGHSAGTVRVAASLAGVSGIASVIIVPPPVATVSVTPPSTELKVGEGVTLAATARDASGAALSGRTAAWASASPAVAEVDGSGRVTALSPGQALIRATIEGVVGTAAVEVVGAGAQTLEITPSAAAMGVGDTQQFEVQAFDGAGDPFPTEGTKWTSSKSEVVTVSATGLATAIAPGAATLTATVGELSASVAVAVSLVPVATVEVVPDSLGIFVGDEASLAAVLHASDGTPISGRDVVWRTDDRAIATVDADGRVIGIAPGETRIVASSEGKSAAAKVVVFPKAVTAVVVDPPSLRMNVGERFTLEAEVRGADGSVLPGALVDWSSGNEPVARVDDAGQVTAVGPGNTTITAASGGRQGTVAVEVVAEPIATIEITPSELTLTEGETASLQATVRASDGDILTGRKVDWSSGRPQVATVDKNGKVTARRAGTAEITARSGGRSASADVRVIGPPERIEIVSGDEQAGLPGTRLRDPLVVRVLDSANQPVEGVTVRWNTSSGSMSPSSNQTGTDGTAATTWTVGVGFTRTASASVEGLSPVTFRAFLFDWSGDDD